MSAAAPAAAPSLTPARLWWHATRPATLAASVAPVLVGVAIAVRDGRLRPGASALALVVGMAMQVGVNYANDYSDFRRGADTPKRVGPPRAAASGVIPPAQVRAAAFGAFGVAAAAGLLLSLTTDPRLLLVGAACILAGWLYTGGPRPYGYLGLGELFVFVFFGLVAAAGTVYVNELRLTPAAWLAGAGTGLLAVGILVLNNIRDIDTDAAAGKRTLAVRLGRARSRVLLAAVLAGALAAPAAGALADARVLELLPLLVAPLAWRVHRLSASEFPPTLVAALKRTAEAELAYALLWTLGLLV